MSEPSSSKPIGIYVLVAILLAAVIGLAVALGVVANRSTDNTVVQNIASSPLGPDEVRINFLHMNDVYELGPLSNGEGGLARLSTFKKLIKDKNPNTIFTLGGDLLSPSAIGVANINNTQIAGAQMVDLVNLIPLDYACFGNHEFDLNQARFQARMMESRFKWISTNSFTNLGLPFNTLLGPVNRSELWTSQDAQPIKIGFLGVAINSNIKNYNSVTNLTSAIPLVRQEVASLKAQGANLIVALTHLALADDAALVAAVPEIDLIFGGHEHENYNQARGKSLVPIFKADANARTVQSVEVIYNRATRKFRYTAQLVRITSDFASDPLLQARADYWTQSAFAFYTAQGVNPTQRVVSSLPEALDATEVAVRTTYAKIGTIIADGMVRYASSNNYNVVNGTRYTIEAAFYNGGSIRVDDVFPVGASITGYDTLRILPFNNLVTVANISGLAIQQALDLSAAAIGTGAWCQYSSNLRRVAGSPSSYFINNVPLDPNRRYIVALTDYLMYVGEPALGNTLLVAGNPNNIFDIGMPRLDSRLAMISQLQYLYPN
eukprot:TRINITY_DN2675_c0_g1_i1.p1 TRINITY_DN2675_c0_g1~~TRINITY_DN2675_c0_g1_i1.p1  ORF type:complete len:549 (+),score=238.81 TRINITY_DN2675_c0_g1_i1:143-1789(+)